MKRVKKSSILSVTSKCSLLGYHWIWIRFFINRANIITCYEEVIFRIFVLQFPLNQFLSEAFQRSDSETFIFPQHIEVRNSMAKIQLSTANSNALRHCEITSPVDLSYTSKDFASQDICFRDLPRTGIFSRSKNLSQMELFPHLWSRFTLYTGLLHNGRFQLVGDFSAKSEAICTRFFQIASANACKFLDKLMPTNFITDYETVHLATRNFLRFSTACMLVLLTQCIYLKIEEFGLSQQYSTTDTLQYTEKL